MAAVGLALLSAFLFGSMTVALRLALRRGGDVALATVATALSALALAIVVAALEAPSRGVHLAGAWPFALAGLLHPGVGQLLATLAVATVGASRTSVVFGMAPLFSVTIALAALGEPASPPLLVGAVLIVAGGAELARERTRPEHLRAIGLAYALVAMVLFAARDNLLRWLSRGTSVPPATAAAASLAGAAVVLVAALAPRLRGRSLRDAAPYLGIGLLFGGSYLALFEAYYRGRVTVVSPLIATESLWGVLLSLLLLRHAEVVGRRLVLGALLVVAGGALIGAVR